jgi:hypothetical protein
MYVIHSTLSMAYLSHREPVHSSAWVRTSASHVARIVAGAGDNLLMGEVYRERIPPCKIRHTAVHMSYIHSVYDREGHDRSQSLARSLTE